jgi:glutamate carboxypeptidase
MNRTLARGSVLALAGTLVSACHATSRTTTIEPGAPLLASATLAPAEVRLRDHVRAHHQDDVALLERAVNISSGSHNIEGVRRVGDLFAAELRALGFTVTWSEMPASMHRAGHLVAVHAGTSGRRILLIGHLDTVFEGEGQRFAREDSIARGAGTWDMKGGDVVIISALRALHATGALENAQITVMMLGDEEAPGDPLEVARRGLIEAGQRNDIALAFEGGRPGGASVTRRGASRWMLTTTATQGHSSGIFTPAAGNGAIYEAARILDGFRRELAGEPTLTFNPGLIGGGTDVQRDSSSISLSAAGKPNIIAPTAFVHGDLRFLRQTQQDSARARMRTIVAQHLSGTGAEIRFIDGYPAMPETAKARALLAQLDAVSRALGHGAIVGDPPESRGAGDISFVTPYLTGMDGLGAFGRGAHSPNESVNLNSLTPASERAAVLMYRLVTSGGQPQGAVP